MSGQIDFELIKRLAREYALFSEEEMDELSRKSLNEELSEEEENALSLARIAQMEEDEAEKARLEAAVDDPMNFHQDERFGEGESRPSKDVRMKRLNRRANAVPPSVFEMFPLRGKSGAIRLPKKAARWEIERRMELGEETSDAEVALLVVALRVCPIVSTLLDTSISDKKKKMPFEVMDAFDLGMWKGALLQTREIMANPALFDPDEFIRRPLLCAARTRGWRWWTRRERGESAESLARRIVEDIDRIYGPLN